METTQRQQIAQTILAQIGKQFCMMVGANQLIALESGLQLRFKGCAKANTLRVVLEPSDTYTVTFLRTGPKTNKVVSTHSDIYCDGLQSLFEEQTGLYTYMHKGGEVKFG